MNRVELISLLGPLVAQTTDRARELLGVLDLERDALVRRDVDTLTEATREKQRLSMVLEELTRQQHGLLSAAGIDTKKAALLRFLEAHDEEGLKCQWTELTDVLEQCRKKNHINGGIIQLSHRFSGQVLDLLRGGPGTGRLYGPSGETASNRPDRRSLAQA